MSSDFCCVCCVVIAHAVGIVPRVVNETRSRAVSDVCCNAMDVSTPAAGCNPAVKVVPIAAGSADVPTVSSSVAVGERKQAVDVVQLQLLEAFSKINGVSMSVLWIVLLT